MSGTEDHKTTTQPTEGTPDINKPQRIRFITCRVLQREAYYCAAKSVNLVDVELVEQGLHNEPDRLRAELQRSIDETNTDTYDAIVLGYGLCSNGIDGLHAPVTTAVLRGHDCMTILLGSKERYREYFDAHRGIYWYSSGWIEHASQPGQARYEKVRAEYIEKYGEENADYLMEMEQNWMREYSRAAHVDWPGLDDSRYRDYTKQCARYLDWEYDELKGDSALLQRLVDGDWRDEEVLVLEPGNVIRADPARPGIIRTEQTDFGKK